MQKFLLNLLLFFFLVFPAFSAQNSQKIISLLKAHKVTDFSITLLNEKGEKQLDLNSDVQMTPASNVKLFTTAAILDSLSPQTTLKTEVYITQSDTVDLKIKGSGDPGFSSRFHKNPYFFFVILAEKLQKRVVKSINTLYLDSSLFTNESYPMGWEEDDKTFYYAPEISPFIFNDSCIDLILTYSEKNGFQYDLFPPLKNYLSFEDFSQISPPDHKFKESYHRKPFSKTVTINHSFPANHKEKEYLSIPSPAYFFGQSLIHHLRHNFGIEIKNIKVLTSGSKKTTQNWQLLHEQHSEPLSRLIQVTNQRSNNLFAETLLRTTAAIVNKKSASFQDGLQIVKGYLKKHQIRGVNITDACGLSKTNKASSHAICRLLYEMQFQRHHKTFLSSLPEAGKSGSLKKRLPKYQGRLFAKTGTLNGIQALSGYFIKNSKNYCFSIILNNSPLTNHENRRLIDQIFTLLY